MLEQPVPEELHPMEQLIKTATFGKDSEEFVECFSCGRDTTLEQGKSVSSSPPEENEPQRQGVMN